MAHAREAFLNRFERELEPDGKFPTRGANHALRARMLRLRKRAKNHKVPRDTT
jgi:hypothetical protein